MAVSRVGLDVDVRCPTCGERVEGWAFDAGMRARTVGLRGEDWLIVEGGRPLPEGAVGPWEREPRGDVYRVEPCEHRVTEEQFEAMREIVQRAHREAGVSER